MPCVKDDHEQLTGRVNRKCFLMNYAKGGDSQNFSPMPPNIRCIIVHWYDISVINTLFAPPRSPVIIKISYILIL